MLVLATRNLTRGTARLVISTGGVGLALTLILVLGGIVSGTERQITAWIDHSGADLIMSQSGVRTMHMSASTLPASVAEDVSDVSGVASVTPVLYVGNMLAAGATRSPVYVIGLPDDATMGRPWSIAQGVAQPSDGTTVIDQRIARAAGVDIGDSVMLLGQPFTISGLSTGTTNIVNSVAFVTARDFVRLRNTDGSPSYLLVRVADGQSATIVGERIASTVPDVTIQTRLAFAAEERRLVRNMTTDLISIMNLNSVVIALAVMALSVYTATFARRGEYGVLKALGADNRQLYGVVLEQAMITVALALVTALSLALALVVILPRMGPNLPMWIGPADVARATSIAIVVAGASALLPIRQIAQVDPAMVFRGGGQP